MILAVLLSVTYTPVPATGQASYIRAHSRQNPKNSADSDKNPARAILPPAETGNDATEPNKAIPNEQCTGLDKSTINITNPTPASIPWGWHERIALWANIALAFFGFIGICIGIGSLIAIWRQGNHITTSERAWMVSSVEGEVIPDSEGLRMVRFSVRCTNNGKTPAFLLEMGNHGIVIPREKPLPEPQLPYRKENTDVWPGCGLPLQPGTSLLRRNFSTVAPDLQRLIHGQDWLWIYGYITYQDSFGNKRETRYCFLWDCTHDIPGIGEESRFLARGPESYIRAT